MEPPLWLLLQQRDSKQSLEEEALQPASHTLSGLRSARRIAHVGHVCVVVVEDMR